MKYILSINVQVYRDMMRERHTLSANYDFLKEITRLYNN